MKKFTKILATVGPATQDEAILANLIASGVNTFRFNLKHNEVPWHAGLIDTVKKIAKELDTPIGTLIDLQGPEVRIVISDEEFEVAEGEEVGVGKDAGIQKHILLSHTQVISFLKKGQKVSIDDGKFFFEVVSEGRESCVLKSSSAGILKSHKTFNMPGAHFTLPVLTEKDKSAIDMCLNHEIDFIALSFVRTSQDVLDLRGYLEGKQIKAKIVSKIETQLALDNLDEIIDSSDGVMIARGDLGIEVPMEQVPYFQKIIIKKCLERGVPVITATQMLSSMTEKAYPTRAEVSDMANAVYDFTDSVMLSEETAAGKYPEQAVNTMARTIAFSEQKVFVPDLRTLNTYIVSGQEEMLCDAAYNLYLQLCLKNNIGGFIVFTQSGNTARKLSRYRPQVPIYAFCPDKKTVSSLTLSFGVLPLINHEIFQKGQQVLIEDVQGALGLLRSQNLYDPKKYYIVLYGDIWMIEGSLSTIKVIPPTEN